MKHDECNIAMVADQQIDVHRMCTCNIRFAPNEL